jgi:Ulp1 family protease
MLRYLDQYKFKEVERWTMPKKLVHYGIPSRGNLFSFDILLVPVHYDGHWLLVGVGVKDRKIVVMDSLKGHILAARKRGFADYIARFLDDEYVARHKTKSNSTGWEIS